MPLGSSYKVPPLQIIDAADEVADSVDKDELAKYFSVKSDPEDEGGEVCIYVANCFLVNQKPLGALVSFYAMIEEKKDVSSLY